MAFNQQQRHQSDNDFHSPGCIFVKVRQRRYRRFIRVVDSTLQPSYSLLDILIVNGTTFIHKQRLACVLQFSTVGCATPFKRVHVHSCSSRSQTTH